MKGQKKKKLKQSLINSIAAIEDSPLFNKNKKSSNLFNPKPKMLDEVYLLHTEDVDVINKAKTELAKEVQSNPKRKQDFQELDALFNEIERIYS